MYNHFLAKPAGLLVNVITPTYLAPSGLWESVGPNTFLLFSMNTHGTCMSFRSAEKVRQPLYWPSCLNVFVYKLYDQNMRAS